MMPPNVVRKPQFVPSTEEDSLQLVVYRKGVVKKVFNLDSTRVEQVVINFTQGGVGQSYERCKLIVA